MGTVDVRHGSVAVRRPLSRHTVAPAKRRTPLPMEQAPLTIPQKPVTAHGISPEQRWPASLPAFSRVALAFRFESEVGESIGAGKGIASTCPMPGVT